MPQRTHLQQRLLFSAVAIGVAILASAYFSFHTLSKILAIQAKAQEYQENKNIVIELRSNLFEAATAQRGFIISGQPMYLEPFYKAVENINKLIISTSPTIDAAPELLAAYSALKVATTEKLKELNQGIDLKQKNSEAAADLIKSGAAKNSLDGLRQITARMVELRELEQKRLVGIYEVEKQYAHQTLIISFAFNIALLAILMKILYGASIRAKDIREEVQAKNNELQSILESSRIRTKHVHDLSELMRFLQSCTNYAEAVQVLNKRLPSLVNANHGALYLFAPSGNKLSIECSWGGEKYIETFEPNECWGLRRGQWFKQPKDGGVLTCKHLNQHVEKDEAGNQSIQYQCFPLIAHSEMLGLLVLGSEYQQADLSHNFVLDEETLQGTLEHLSLSLGNLNLRESLRQQSIRDVLTGLYNRRFLFEFIERELTLWQRKQSPSDIGIAVLMLDIDHFKSFNDQHGHDVGDVVLKEVANALRKTVRRSDVASRYGGEEFTVVMPDITFQNAFERAELIRAEIEKIRVNIPGKSVERVTTSIGLAHHPQDGETAETLISLADKALYQAKRSGRNRVVAFKQLAE